MCPDCRRNIEEEERRAAMEPSLPLSLQVHEQHEDSKRVECRTISMCAILSDFWILVLTEVLNRINNFLC